MKPSGIPDPGVCEDIGDELRLCREEIVTNLEEARELSEREVLAAGAVLVDIVSEAQSYVDEVKSSLGSLLRGDEDDVATAIAHQTAAVGYFVIHTKERMQEQDSVAQLALEQSESILIAGRSIKKLANASKLLALNARIEATRLGDKGETFEVIAGEMRDLSESVEEANRQIADLASSLLELLPKLASTAHEVLQHSETFSIELSDHMTAIDEGTNQLREKATFSVTQGEQRVERILSGAHRAISHLQFQDPMIQQLQQIEHRYHEMQSAVGRKLHVELTPAEKRYQELLSNTMDESECEEVEQDAGDVLLF